MREAARNGEIEKVRKIVSLGVNINAKDESGYTALHWYEMDEILWNNDDFRAAIGGYLQVLNHLLKSGAGVNIVDSGGWTG